MTFVLGSREDPEFFWAFLKIRLHVSRNVCAWKQEKVPLPPLMTLSRCVISPTPSLPPPSLLPFILFAVWGN